LLQGKKKKKKGKPIQQFLSVKRGGRRGNVNAYQEEEVMIDILRIEKERKRKGGKMNSNDRLAQ